MLNINSLSEINALETHSLSSKPYTVWHVGRSGDAACGMAQVINAYAQWNFDQFTVKTINSWGAGKGLSGILLFLQALKWLLCLKATSHDLVVIHLSHKGSFVREGLLLWVAKLKSCASIGHIHGSQFVAFAHRWPKLARWVLHLPKCIIVLSETSQQAVLTLAPSARVVLVPNAVNPGNIVAKQKWIVFGGGVTLRKGVDTLIQAWSNITHKGHWVLKIVGPVGADIQKLLDSGEIQISSQLDMLGAQPHGHLMALLDGSQVAVLPSRNEAMPMFILEAMARKNCVISTPVGGIAAVLAEHRGLLVPPGEVAPLVEALNQVIQNDADRADMAERAYQHYDTHYSAGIVFVRLEALWLSVLNPAKPIEQDSCDLANK